MREVTYSFMKHPVSNLELNPGCGQQVQRSSRDETLRFSLHEPLADQTRIRRPQLFVRWLLSILSWEVASKAHSSTAHARKFQRIELAIRVTRVVESLLWQGFFDCISLCGASHVCIIEILGPKLNAENGKVQSAHNGRQFVPWSVFVDEFER